MSDRRQVQTGEIAPGWYPDPTLRFELRYHNGGTWTADVAVDGDRFVDPNGTNPTPAPLGPSAGQPALPEHGQASNGAATASMVLGITAIVVGWLPYVVAIGAIAAVLALVLGRRGRQRAAQSGTGGGFALAGMITGAVGLLVCVGGVLFTISMVRTFEAFDSPADHDATITSCEREGNRVIATGSLTNTDTEAATFSVRVSFVRSGTDNAQSQDLVSVGRLEPGETTTFEAARNVDLDDVDCIIGAVRGPLPYGIDPGT